MQLPLMLVKAVLLGLAVATPFSNNLADRHSGKCKWKDRRCCQYQDGDYKSNGWEYGSENHYKHSRTIYVTSGKSIQRAINSASYGDRIVVAAGTYAEQLTIDKDGIQLIGNNAILIPPAKPIQNTCSGLSGPNTEAGICITGSGVKLAKFVVEHRKFLSAKRLVRDILITGFQVRKFSGINIVVVGASNGRLIKNTLTDGGQYGALTLGSFNTLVEENSVSSATLGGIGICMDNQSGVLVSNNHVSNQFVGLCVQTREADVQYNEVTASCFGIFVDPGVNGAKIRHNRVGPTNPICSQIGADAGIMIDGAVNTKVLDNDIQGQKIGGNGLGIAILDDPCTANPPSLKCLSLHHAAIASGNIILRNTLRNNDLDIFVNTTGHGNLIACNICSTPEKLCKF